LGTGQAVDMLDPLGTFANRLAGMVMSALAPRLKAMVVGSDESRALQRAITRASRALLRDLTSLDEHGKALLGWYFQDGQLGAIFAEAAFARSAPDRASLERRLTELGYDPGTSPIDLVAVAIGFCSRLHDEVRSEAEHGGSPLFNQYLLEGLDRIPQQQYGSRGRDAGAVSDRMLRHRQHFLLRARGVPPGSRLRGWYFTGRVRVLRDLSAWLTVPNSSPNIPRGDGCPRGPTSRPS
jgi:hypothetical protein